MTDYTHFKPENGENSYQTSSEYIQKSENSYEKSLEYIQKAASSYELPPEKIQKAENSYEISTENIQNSYEMSTEYIQNSYDITPKNSYTHFEAENSWEDICWVNWNCSESDESKKLTSKWRRKRAYEMTLPVEIRQKRRLAANARERKRMTSLNQAFEKLREILPNQHRDRPLSKMEALQLAQSYIKELAQSLNH